MTDKTRQTRNSVLSAHLNPPARVCFHKNKPAHAKAQGQLHKPQTNLSAHRTLMEETRGYRTISSKRNLEFPAH